jgi:hypothetical protein
MQSIASVGDRTKPSERIVSTRNVVEKETELDANKRLALEIRTQIEVSSVEERKKRKFENRVVAPLRPKIEGSKMNKSSIEGSEISALNPFRRRECAPTVMWDVGKKKEAKTINTPQPQRTERSETSPEKRKEIFSVLKELETIDILASFPGNINETLDELERHTNSEVCRLTEHIRCIQGAYPRDLGFLWTQNIPGEVMTLSEWRSRIAQVQTSNL